MKTLALAACASVCAFTLSASALGAGDISLPKQIRCKDISNSQDAVVHLLEAPIVTHAEEVTNRSQIVSEPNSGRFEPSVDDLNKVILFTGNSRFPDGRNEALQNFELAKVNNAYQWGVTLTSKSLVYSFLNSSSGVFVHFNTEDLIRGASPIMATVNWTHYSDNSEGSFQAPCTF